MRVRYVGGGWVEFDDETGAYLGGSPCPYRPRQPEHLEVSLGSSTPMPWFPASTVNWGAVGTLVPEPPRPPKPVPCASCHKALGRDDEKETCQICGETYHRRGCGITTLYSRTCNRCRRERRMPVGYEVP